MLQFPSIDPIALRVGMLELRWYGIMYLLAFATAWILGRYRVKLSNASPHPSQKPWITSGFDDLITMCMLGVILGGRLGFVLFYDLARYLQDPLEILSIWNGGMSFHGGLLGVLAAIFIYARRNQRTFWEVTDFIAPLVPSGIFFGRVGNFINGELWGNVTNVPWGMVFPHAGPLPRHPSQLYEASLEGIVLFIALWLYSARPHYMGRVSGLFALGYGLARFMVEFVRTPDAHLGYLAFNWLTMGQILSLPLMGIGLWLLLRKPTIIINNKKTKTRKKKS